MNVANVHATKQWFEVLQTTKQSQTAVMVLSAGGQSSEETNVHRKSDQILLVVEGHVRAEVAGEQRLLQAGEVCVIPAGTEHRFENAGEKRALTFNVYTPPEYAADEKG
jgi:mannose-6-phosphate isomerase-like protein (cupin superfamily)